MAYKRMDDAACRRADSGRPRAGHGLLKNPLNRPLERSTWSGFLDYGRREIGLIGPICPILPLADSSRRAIVLESAQPAPDQRLPSSSRARCDGLAIRSVR
jgi:hypothetical protein